MAKLSSGTLGMPSTAGVDLLPCPSSAMLQHAEYNPKELTATFVFKTGAIHRYGQVYSSIWQQFKDAPSKGRAYNQLFKNKLTSKPILLTNVGRQPSAKKSI
jgi:hypothetical protein